MQLQPTTEKVLTEEELRREEQMITLSLLVLKRLSRDGNPDAVYLAVAAAAKDADIPFAEAQVALKPLLDNAGQGSIWWRR